MLIRELKGAEMKNRLKNYNFWISIFSAVLLILQALKIEFDIAYVNEIFTAVLGLLVVVGIIIDPTKTATSAKPNTAISVDEAKNSENEESDTKLGKETLPIDQKSENDIVNNENDIKNVLAKISIDLENKLKQIENLNNETAKCLEKIQNKTKQENVHVEILPAVAEMENPYIDLMK